MSERAQPKKSDSAVKAYEEKPDYLAVPTAKAAYTYDAVGNRLSLLSEGATNGTPPGLTDARGWGNNSDRPASAKTGNHVVAIDLNKVASYVDISTPEARDAVKVSGWQANAFAQASAEVLIHKGVPAEAVLPYVPLQ